MEKARKRETVSTLMITADEVAALWRKATSGGPYPDQEQNEATAQVLSIYRIKESDHQEDERPTKREILSAIDLLSTVCVGHDDEDDPTLVWWDPDFLSLAKALVTVRTRVSAYPEPASCTWRVAAIMAWTLAEASLEALNRHSGVSRNSVTVNFIVLALRRMGWPYVNGPGVEAFLLKAQARLEATGIQKPLAPFCSPP